MKENYLFIDPKNAYQLDKTQEKLLEAVKCTICKGVVRKMPGVSCGECDQVYCSEPCFWQLEDKKCLNCGTIIIDQ
jgi:hypothetical protein